MQTKFEDWKKSNPHGSLNEYFRSVQRTEIPAYDNDPVYVETKSVNNEINYRNFIIGISISLIGFIGYFLPWFTIPIFNISVSGNDITQLSNLFKNHLSTTNISFVKYSFCIPISYGVIFLGAISKSYITSVVGILASILTVGFLLFKILFDMQDLISFMNIGIYAIGISWCVSWYYLIVLK